MPTGSTLLDFGVAINFFGNYRRESQFIESSTNSMRSALMSLQNMLIGGSFIAAIYKFTSSLVATMQRVEMQFAQLKTSLGSVERATETMRWAKEMGMKTALESNEVINAVVSMTRSGLAADKASRDKNFNALADFTAQFAKPKGMSFDDVVDSVTKASFGNWERLGDNFGIRKTTIGTQVQNALANRGIDDSGKNPLAYTTQEAARMKELTKTVQTAKQGSNELKYSLVELLGLMSKGGMNEQLKTLAGTWSNMMDIPTNFMEQIVGITQVQGSLANKINTTLNEMFNKLQAVNAQGVSALDNIMRFGRDIGDIFVSIWGDVDKNIGSLSDRIVKFLQDYENNIAPIVLFLALVKIQIQEFFRGFWDGFKMGFMPFITLGMAVWKVVGEIAKMLGIGASNAEALGKILGTVLGVLMGMRAFKFIVSPLTGLLNESRILLTNLNLASAKMKMGANWTIAESATFRWWQLKDGVAKLVPMLTAASGASWAFTASLLANPITWVVLAVAALVGWLVYLIRNWEEVGQKMQGVNDTFLAMGAILLPIVGIPLIMAKYWGQFKEIFTNIWNGIKGYIEGVGYFISAKINNWLIKPFKAFLDLNRQLFAYLKQEFPFVGKIFDAIGTGIRTAIEWIDNLWTKITSFFADGWIGKALDWIGDVAEKFGESGQSFAESQKQQYQESIYKAPTPAPQNSGTQQTTTNTYTFGNVVLPNVQNPEQFLPALQGAIQRTGK